MDRYLKVTSQIGWRITIHNQMDFPFPEENGFFVEPGTSTRVGISESFIKKISSVDNILYKAVYSECNEQKVFNPDDELNAYSKMLEVAYTQSVLIFFYLFFFLSINRKMCFFCRPATKLAIKRVS